MNIGSHLKLASLICKSSKIKIYGFRKILFALGNIFPDISFTFIRNPHLPDIMFDNVMCKIDAQILRIEKNNNINYFSIGIITHYLSDFFCAAHTKPFGEDVRKHYQYESQLERRLHLIRISVLNSNASDSIDNLIRVIEQQHNEYLSHPPSYKNDILFITKICMLCVLSYQNQLLAINDELTVIDPVLTTI